MRAPSKLIRPNNPDLVLFFGEALVGNIAVHQLSRFIILFIVLRRLAYQRLTIEHCKMCNPPMIVSFGLDSTIGKTKEIEH